MLPRIQQPRANIKGLNSFITKDMPLCTFGYSRKTHSTYTYEGFLIYSWDLAKFYIDLKTYIK